MKEKEKKYGLLKGILLFIVIAILLSWLIPTGEFQTTGYVTENTLTRVGFNDIAWLIYYGIQFSIEQLVFLLVLAGLYGVMTKTEAYDRIVTSIASKFKNKTVTVVVTSVIIALFTSILTQTFAVLIFIPFIISILNRMKIDKMTIMSVTFGSMLVGVLGATYGTNGAITLLSNYMLASNSTVHDTLLATILVRAGILVVGLVLFNFFNLNNMKKNANSESIDLFKIEKNDDDKVAKRKNIIPIIVFGVLMFILVILGYIGWEKNFNITVFKEFHTAVFDVKIGNDFYIFKSLLGSQMKEFGAWDLFTIIPIIMTFTLLISLCYRFKFNELIDSVTNGMKKMVKPCLCIIGATVLMIVVYMSLYIATVLNKLYSLTDGFNLATMIMSSLVANIFHTDLGYTGYIVGNYLITEYVDYINPVQVIFISLYGFVQFFVPTSVVLGIGLTSLKVSYGEWLKYIWRFLVGIFICLLLIFILMAIL